MKHIHFIGICGVAMSALATAFHKQGWKVTGSDKGFYPPVSNYLKDAGINYYPGWHPDKMTLNGDPDLVIVGNVAGSTNPEWIYVQEHDIPYKSYPEAIAEYLIADNSIVCAGTYGKTTTSSLLAWILLESGYNPNYMFGALSQNDLASASISGDGTWSVVEGDEYKSARWDMRPKFAHYSPTHLLLTAIIWDHADIYPTEQRYIDTFKDLFASVPDEGIRVVSEQALAVLEDIALDKELVSYGKADANDYVYTNVTQSVDGLTFDIINGKKTWTIKSPLIGDYNAENICACFAMARTVGVAPKNIIKAIARFQGIKRRLEKRADGDVTIFDDIAHSPTKATSVLETLRDIYSGKIIAVFEPNTGNRKEESLPVYKNAFTKADTVVIPRLTTVKIAKNDPSPPFDGKRLAEVIAQSHPDVNYIEDDDALVRHLKKMTSKGDVIVFLGSHGFRGMIEQTMRD